MDWWQKSDKILLSVNTDDVGQHLRFSRTMSEGTGLPVPIETTEVSSPATSPLKSMIWPLNLASSSVGRSDRHFIARKGPVPLHPRHFVYPGKT